MVDALGEKIFVALKHKWLKTSQVPIANVTIDLKLFVSVTIKGGDL